MIGRLTEKLIDRLIARAQRTPYSHLTDYMQRWWLVPYPDRKYAHGCGPVRFRDRPFAWLLQKAGISSRVHHILRSDKDVPHDHPSWSLSVILRGGYFEVIPVYDIFGCQVGVKRKWCGPGSILFRRADKLHRLELPEGQTCWSIFTVGRKCRKWGYRCPDGRWLPHEEFDKTGCAE